MHAYSRIQPLDSTAKIPFIPKHKMAMPFCVFKFTEVLPHFCELVLFLNVKVRALRRFSGWDLYSSENSDRHLAK
jgi:hypothetical protein